MDGQDGHDDYGFGTDTLVPDGAEHDTDYAPARVCDDTLTADDVEFISYGPGYSPVGDDIERAGFQEDVRSIAELVASTVIAKNAAYGDSFARSGEVLSILYPQGIPVTQIHTALFITRTIDKLFRLATDNDPFGEDPSLDLAGYAILNAVYNRRCR